MVEAADKRFVVRNDAGYCVAPPEPLGTGTTAFAAPDRGFPWGESSGPSGPLFQIHCIKSPEPGSNPGVPAGRDGDCARSASFCAPTRWFAAPAPVGFRSAGRVRLGE